MLNTWENKFFAWYLVTRINEIIRWGIWNYKNWKNWLKYDVGRLQCPNCIILEWPSLVWNITEMVVSFAANVKKNGYHCCNLLNYIFVTQHVIDFYPCFESTVDRTHINTIINTDSVYINLTNLKFQLTAAQKPTFGTHKHATLT